MGKLDSITTLATLAVGGLVFLKVYPLLEGFLTTSGSGGIGGGFLEQFIPVVGQAPLRTYDPVPDVRDIPLSGQLGYSEYPVITAEEYEARKEAWLAAQFPDPPAGGVLPWLGSVLPEIPPFVPPATTTPTPPPATTTPTPPPTGVLPWLGSVLPEIPPFVPPATTTPLSGDYWINPLTQAVIAPYVRGETPQAVLDLREDDILPSIRGF